MGRRIGSLEHSDLEKLSRGRVGGGQLLGWRGAVPLDLRHLFALEAGNPDSADGDKCKMQKPRAGRRLRPR